jgi:hypothetical protein
MTATAVSHAPTKTTLAITSVVQCTPSSTRENPVAAMASPATSQDRTRSTRLPVRATTHRASAVQATAAVAVCPDGNDQPCAVISRSACGGRSRAIVSLAMRTPSASPAQAATAMTAAMAGSRLVSTSSAMTAAATASATHEPSHVTAFMAALSAAVRELTTSRVTP